ncbi:MAG: GntR family transcriptional regulator [Elainellaceae cyanobacterium]
MSQASDNYGPGRRWEKGANIATMSVSTTPINLADQPVHDWVYHSLRRMILYNEIEPGAWLRQKDISGQFQVSRTPVREAFRTLSQEGLVELVPNYGARVTQLSMEEFEEIYALRLGIEGLAARLTAEKMTPEQLPSLRQALDDLSSLTKAVDLLVYLQQEWQFRVLCYQLTERQRLLKQVLFLREHSERYIYLAYGVETRIAESFDFHCRLLDAIAAQDGVRAEMILQDALRWTLRNAGPIVASFLKP